MAYVPDVSVMGGYANQTCSSHIQPNIGFVGLSGSYTFFEWGEEARRQTPADMDMAMANQNVQVTLRKVAADCNGLFPLRSAQKNIGWRPKMVVKPAKMPKRELPGLPPFRPKPIRPKPSWIT